MSHALRQLEAGLGVRLLHRTTRSVAPTDAGLRLYDKLRPAVADIEAALEELKGEESRPSGRLRLYATHAAAAAIVMPVWARYLAACPEVRLELHLDEAPADIVARGFDAGIGPQNRASADMVALRVTGPIRLVVVGAPTYFRRRGEPKTPDDLGRHSCVQYRFASDGAMTEWPFERAGRSRRIAVEGRVVVNDPELAVRAAVDGLGLAYTIEALALPFLRSGQLAPALEDWAASFDGLYLYYPGHQPVPAALRRLIDMIRAAPGAEAPPLGFDNPLAAAE